MVGGPEDASWSPEDEQDPTDKAMRLMAKFLERMDEPQKFFYAPPLTAGLMYDTIERILESARVLATSQPDRWTVVVTVADRLRAAIVTALTDPQKEL